MKIKDIHLTDNTLTNIIIMAPHLDEMAQNRVFGMICGLMRGNEETKEKEEERKERERM